MSTRLVNHPALHHRLNVTEQRCFLCFFLGALLFTAFLIGVPVRAEAPWPSGEDIAQRINARDDGQFVSWSLSLELINRHGKTRLREARGFRKHYAADKRTAWFYVSPKRVKDIALLTFDYRQAGRDDDQWLYLPAMRKTRRIAATDRGDYFLGTDFTYEDMKKESKVTIEDYIWKTIGEETFDGRRCYLLEATPVNQQVAKELGYGKTLSWVDAEQSIVRKAQFWDIRQELLKMIHITDIRPVQDILTAHQIECHNHQTEHTTRFTFSSFDYNTEIADELFTERALRRGL
jgi:outer membrane lipoprotein-sorting protein